MAYDRDDDDNDYVDDIHNDSSMIITNIGFYIMCIGHAVFLCVLENA